MSTFTTTEQPDLVDPDPYTVSSIIVSAAALVLQLIQFAKESRPQEVQRFQPDGTSDLSHFESSLEELLQSINQLLRTVDRASLDPEKEFYEVTFGISLAIFKIERKWHGDFTSNIADTYMKVSATARWINHLIGQNPEMARQIGDQMTSSLSEASETLNQFIREGATNGAIIGASRHVLEACRTTVTALIDSKSRN